MNPSLVLGTEDTRNVPRYGWLSVITSFIHPQLGVSIHLEPWTQKTAVTLAQTHVVKQA